MKKEFGTQIFSSMNEFNQQSHLLGLPHSSMEDLVIFACSLSRSRAVSKRKIEKIPQMVPVPY